MGLSPHRGFMVSWNIIKKLSNNLFLCKDIKSMKKYFLTFPACFSIPIIFSNLKSNCSYLSNLRNLQEQFKKEFCYQRCFWPFTVWINCSSDLKSFSRSLEQFFLTVGQNNFDKKIPEILWWVFLDRQKRGKKALLDQRAYLAGTEL